MAFLLLLALICSVSFAYLTWSKSDASRLWAVAFGFLSLNLIAQLVLGYRLNESWAKLFYFARYTMVVFAFGAALALSLFPRHRTAQNLPLLVLGVSLLGVVLVGSTQLSRAVDWYQTAKPLYPQITDLLATNRPTRWLAAGLTAVGSLALFVVPVYAVLRRRLPLSGAAALVTGGALLLAPLIWPPQLADSAFYVSEALASFLMFAGFKLVGER
jgi:hypothetical protein